VSTTWGPRRRPARPRRGRAGMARPGGVGGGWAPALTPKVAVRIAILGGIAMALLGVLLVRLWFLQVINEQQYVQRADSNYLRTLVTPAPRGNILSSDGQTLVANRPSENVVADPRELTKGKRRQQVLRRLATKLPDTTYQDLLRAVKAGEKNAPLEPVLLAENVDGPLYRYLAEHARDYPGIDLQESYVRTYPDGTLAAHVLGSTGRITPEELQSYRRRGYVGNEIVGTGGVEQAYERYLAGTPGKAVVEVDAGGHPQGDVVSSQLPLPGRNIELSIDVPTQEALEQSIADAAGVTGATGAAGVALDPRTGEVLGLASFPTFSPEVFVKRKPKVLSGLLNDPQQPLFDRAIQGVYPSGSTFKPITATSALQHGLLDPQALISSPSEIKLHDHVFPNFEHRSEGDVNLPTALEISSDTYFYQVADRLWQDQVSRKGDYFPLQATARDYGLGKPTGIDLPGESGGLVPDPPWKRKHFVGIDPSTGNKYTDLDRSWFAGDTINLGVGQGYLQVTPLQMANAYAAIADGGTVRTPTVVSTIEDPNGRVVKNVAGAQPSRKLDISPGNLAVIRDGLYRVANDPNGTAYSVFSRLPAEDRAAGKTGTAESTDGSQDHSWFVGYAPAADPKIVVAVVIEHGGQGANAAAPAVCQTMGAYLHFDAKLCGAAQRTN
jgi:penicillin-binding protein 2